MILRLLAYHNVLIDCALAVIPVVLAYTMLWVASMKNRRRFRKPAVAALGLAWLAFLPNTCYLLTEWRHYLIGLDQQNLFIRAAGDKFLFIDLCQITVFYLVFSGFGMLMFAMAIRPVERLAIRKGASTWFWAVPFFTALSLGVYLGLVLRFNSWDSIMHPKWVWFSIVELAGRPRLVGFIIAFGVFLWMAYEAIDLWIDGLSERWSRITGRRIHLGPKSR